MAESQDMVLMRAIEHHATIVAAYDGSEVHGHVVALLNALAESYKLDLIDVDPAGLVRVQSAIKQVLAIRNAITGSGPIVPRI